MKNGASFLFYFLYFAALSALIPYLVLYYNQRGLNGAQIGLLSSIGPLISMASSPMWAGLADLTRRYRMILSLNGLAAAALALIYPSAPDFAGLMALMALFALASAPVATLADTAVMFMFKGDGGKYGRVRLGGTLGWGMIAPLAGLLIEVDGARWMFWGYAGLLSLALLCAQALDYPQPRATSEAVVGAGLRPAPTTPSFWHGLRTLLADRRWLVLLSILFLGGFGLSILNSYLLLLMQSIGARQSLMGLTLSAGTISEIPALFFVNRLTRRFSPRSLLLLALGALGLRLLLTGLAIQPGWALVVQLTHGLTFPLFWVAGVSFAHQNAPAGLHATAQGIMGAVFTGLGAAAGTFVGGLLLGSFDISEVYQIYGMVMLLALGAFALITRSSKLKL